MTRMRCTTCDSEDVFRDAWAEWDPRLGEWVLQNVFDYAHCISCNGECSIKETDQ